MTKIITEDMVKALPEKVRPYLKEKRYAHTLGVEREAEALGRIFLPEKILQLRCAALLHDITKKLSADEQISLCNSLGIHVEPRLIASPKLFHSRTAAELISVDFPEYADDEIISGVRWHTTGHQGMTVFEAIIYLADYIEDTRTFDDCVTLRKYFYDNLQKCSSYEDKVVLLRKTMVLSFDLTIKCLIEENAPLDTDTIEARNYYISLQRIEV